MSEQKSHHGVIDHSEQSTQQTDYLYRISLKCLVRNGRGEVLVVKETGRHYWDLPGGGMSHGEDIRSAIAREMHEEVNLRGDFTYRIIDVDEPALLNSRDSWQVRLIFEVTPSVMSFKAGEDGDAVTFKNPQDFKESAIETERRIYHYSQLAMNSKI